MVWRPSGRALRSRQKLSLSVRRLCSSPISWVSSGEAEWFKGVESGIRNMWIKRSACTTSRLNGVEACREGLQRVATEVEGGEALHLSEPFG